MTMKRVPTRKIYLSRVHSIVENDAVRIRNCTCRCRDKEAS